MTVEQSVSMLMICNERKRDKCKIALIIHSERKSFQ